MKDFLKNIIWWQILMLIGIFIIFLALSWYVFEYKGDSSTVALGVASAVATGMLLIIDSYYLYKKKLKRDKDEASKD